jgi:hypothetical protein
MPLTKARPLLLMALLPCLGLGCTGASVSLRADGSPGPEDCPDGAAKMMKLLRLQPGDTAWIEIDANQAAQTGITLSDGPVESQLDEDLGVLPAGSRLYGRIWTSGPNVNVRYYEARPPDGDIIPFCGVARLAGGGLKKKPGSRPGTAVLDSSRAGVYIVDAFR